MSPHEKNNSSLRPDRAALRKYQQSALSKLLKTLLDDNVFYQQKWKAAGLSEAQIRQADLESFTRIFPFTTKQELTQDQATHPPYGTTLTYPLERYTKFHQTSASSGGTPLRWLDTAEDWLWMVANWRQVFTASAAVTSQDCVYFAFSFGPFLGFWTAFQAAEELGCLCIPGGGMSTTARLRALLENKATILCCTPTYAMRMAQVAQEENIDLGQSSVRAIIVGGEPGGSLPSVYEKIEAAWPGAKVLDHHGMTEIGPVSWQCTENPTQLHVIEASYLAEVLQPCDAEIMPADQPHVAPGEVGELVLTTLGRSGNPLLRYRTGDLVRAGSPTCCACGYNDLSLEGGILSRSDDMLVVRGVNVFPSAVEEIIRAQKQIVEFRVEVQQQRGMNELALQIETDADCADPQAVAAALKQALQNSYQLRIPVRVAEPGSLPRFEMKANRWSRK